MDGTACRISAFSIPSARLQLFKLVFFYQGHTQESPRDALPILSLPLEYSQVSSPRYATTTARPRRLIPPFFSPQHRQDSRTMSRVREKEPYRYRTQSKGTCLFTSIKVSVPSSRGAMDPVRKRFKGAKSGDITLLETETKQALPQVQPRLHAPRVCGL